MLELIANLSCSYFGKNIWNEQIFLFRRTNSYLDCYLIWSLIMYTCWVKQTSCCPMQEPESCYLALYQMLSLIKRNLVYTVSELEVLIKPHEIVYLKDLWNLTVAGNQTLPNMDIRVITKLPNSEKSYKGKVKTHNYINRQNQSTTGKLWKP